MSQAPARAGGVVPNVIDYDRARAAFSWDGVRRTLDGLPGGRGLNIAHEAVDRYASGPRRDRVAVRWIRRNGPPTASTYRQLAMATNRFANALQELGVGRGDCVFTLAGRIPEIYAAALGSMKNGSVFSPLFASFGPDPIYERLHRGNGRVLVTTLPLYRRKVASLRDGLPELEHVLLAGLPEPGAPDGALWLSDLLAAASEQYEIPATDPDAGALLHFTSGTTGRPKGAVIPHEAVVALAASGWSVLDLHPADVFWCTADPGWVTGTCYGMITPLVHGVTTIVDEGELEAGRWYDILEREGVTVWYTAPTALRMLRRAGVDLARAHDLSALRLVASVGEPLEPDLVRWGREAFGAPVLDTWWQTETGAIMIGNFAGCEVRPGSMGRALPGIDVDILARGRDGRAAIHDGHVDAVAGPEVVGELALRRGWPSMFRGYLHDDDAYRRCFAGGWYLTGDLARCDADGYVWFVGRADDVIKSAGHLIGPAEVEAALMQHDAVLEAGAIGVPDAVAGEVVQAFVALRPGVVASQELRLDLIGFARRHLGAVAAPRDIVFQQDLPHTRSGKIMRRLLRGQHSP